MFSYVRVAFYFNKKKIFTCGVKENGAKIIFLLILSIAYCKKKFRLNI